MKKQQEKGLKEKNEKYQRKPKEINRKKLIENENWKIKKYYLIN